MDSGRDKRKCKKGCQLKDSENGDDSLTEWTPFPVTQPLTLSISLPPPRCSLK